MKSRLSRGALALRSLLVPGSARLGRALACLAASAVARWRRCRSITPDELKEWLSYIASDQLQGRRVYTEGLGLAAAYIADHLKEWGVKPAATTAPTSRW